MIMAKKTLLEELEEIEVGDELPLSNRTFARIMRHLCSNHIAHLYTEVKILKTMFKLIILPLLLLILAAIVGLAIRGG
jgi:hypothetical protein